MTLLIPFALAAMAIGCGLALSAWLKRELTWRTTHKHSRDLNDDLKGAAHA